MIRTMQKLEPAAPFAIAAISFSIADVNAMAALVLTVLGIVYTSRKIWLSFQRKERNEPAD